MEEAKERFSHILYNTLGSINVDKFTNEEIVVRFKKWAASWDCKEAETDGQDSPMIGDEIEVGTLWEDKSQKDFKSYL